MTKHIDEATGVETVGHEWDGIEELNNPLPRWWLWTFYATIVFAVGYTVAYPAIPMLSKATEGAFGWSSRGALADELQAERARREPLMVALERTPIEELQRQPELMQQAVAGGRAAFRVNCVQCHGAGAAGSTGYPNLNDDEWLWGGNLQEIEQTITHGIRHPDDTLTRASLMPSFGRDGILKSDQVADVTAFVRTLSGRDPASAASQRGAELFATNCVVCHGPAGQGDRRIGAPNLSDAIWLYGGSRDAIAESVTNAHAGVMPGWNRKLDKATIRMLAVYVHSLGGGEDFAPAPTDPATPVAAPELTAVAANDHAQR